jgi:WD40 repeat protein
VIHEADNIHNRLVDVNIDGMSVHTVTYWFMYTFQVLYQLAVFFNVTQVVSVWDVVDKELRLKAHLFGHSEPITCLTCSPSYNIIVSGSKDLTCIIWDLARLSFVRQLVSHSAPVDAVGVNELTGKLLILMLSSL